MNKKTKTKILTLSAISALSLAAIWVLASNANNLLKFDWEVKQDAHLELSGVTLIAPTQSSNFDVSFKMSWDQLITLTGTNTARNSVQGNGTLSFWGSNNKTSDPESLILGGSGNTIDLKAKNTIILASDKIQALWGSGSVVLGSTNARIKGQWNIIQATHWASIFGNDNIILAADNVNIYANTNNSMAIGKKININHNGSFVFNGTSKWVPTKKNNTAIIAAKNGMIINTETKTATNTDLTISGSLQVGIGSQIDKDGAIISDRCIKLKGISNGEIGLECRAHTNFWGENSLPKTPKCGRNATNYAIHESNWRGTNKADFCSEGELDITKENKGFRTLEERTTATGKGMYASKGFPYNFTICFWDRDPLCAPKKLSKTWRCKTQEGNAIRCEANLQIKKMECDAKTHHFEDVNQTNWYTYGDQWQCLPNTKFVDCDSKGLDATNGRFSNAIVKVEREKSRRNYTAPQACKLECLDGYHLADNNTRCESNTREVSCENRNHVVDTEWGHITNSTYIETRDSEKWRPKEKNTCRLSCNEGGALNSAGTSCELSHKIKRCNPTFSSWTWLNYIISYHKYYRDPSLKKIPDAKLCDFSCNPWYNKASKKRKCVQCDASKNRDASSESCVDKTKYTCENIPENSHQVGSPNYQQNVSAKLIDESSNSTEPCTYKCNPGYRKQWNQCQEVCNSDQHLENGSCVSNTKNVDCDATDINTENGTINRKKVTAHWVDEKWTTPKCELTCNTGYRKDDSNSHNIHCARSKVEKYQWKCEQTLNTERIWGHCDKHPRSPATPTWGYWIWNREHLTVSTNCTIHKTKEKCEEVKYKKSNIFTNYCFWSWQREATTIHKTYMCIDKTTGSSVPESLCEGIQKPTECSSVTANNPNKPKCWDGEYYNPTTKTCESRCIWQYGYEDAGYSYQEKENSWWACFSTQEYSEEDHYQSYRFDYYEKIFGPFTKDDCLSRGYQWGVPIEQRYSPSNSISQYVTKLYKSCQDYDPRYCKKVYNEQDLRECSDFSTEESCREEQSCDRKL